MSELGKYKINKLLDIKVDRIDRNFKIKLKVHWKGYSKK